MMWNDEAIGGFLEDLPVLAFILTGSLLIVSTNVFVTEQIGDMERLQSLELSAEKIVDVVIAALSEAGFGEIPLDSVRQMNLSALSLTSGLLAVSALKISIIMIHPWQELVNGWSSGVPDASLDTGWHSHLFNVCYAQYTVGVGEVVVVVFD